VAFVRYELDGRGFAKTIDTALLENLLGGIAIVYLEATRELSNLDDR
jgi:hypothetical protein